MKTTTRNKQLRKYAGQLAERMGVKIDMSKIKSKNDLPFIILYLMSKYKGIDFP
jgi:hypothetical protein